MFDMRNNIKFDFDDILITPVEVTEIDSRKDVDIYDENGFLPLFTAPMDTVVSTKNLHYFTDNKIYPIIPRTERNVSHEFKNEWQAIGLNEFENIIKDLTYEKIMEVYNKYFDFSKFIKSVDTIDF